MKAKLKYNIKKYIFSIFLFLFIDQQLGRNLARTFLDFYKSNNYVSWSPSCSIMPKLKEDRIKSRLSRQSANMPIVDQDEAYEITLVGRSMYACNDVCLFFI